MFEISAVGQEPVHGAAAAMLLPGLAILMGGSPRPPVSIVFGVAVGLALSVVLSGRGRRPGPPGGGKPDHRGRSRAVRLLGSCSRRRARGIYGRRRRSHVADDRDDGLEGHSILSSRSTRGAPKPCSRRPTPAACSRASTSGDHWRPRTPVSRPATWAPSPGSAHALDGLRRERVRPLFTSTNGGDSWTESAAPTAHICVTAIAPDPVTPGTIYWGPTARASSSRTDGGGKWSHLTNGLKRATVWNLWSTRPRIPRPSMPARTKASTRASTPARLWTPSNRGLTSINVLAVVSDPKCSRTSTPGRPRGFSEARTPATAGARSHPTCTRRRSPWIPLDVHALRRNTPWMSSRPSTAARVGRRCGSPPVRKRLRVRRTPLCRSQTQSFPSLVRLPCGRRSDDDS